MIVRDVSGEFEERNFMEEGASLPYRLLKPRQPGMSVRYPLVLFLHGAGEKGSDNERQVANGVERFAFPENRRKYPCFVVVPQCPADEWWTGFGPGPTGSLRLARGIVESLKREFTVDERRLYITGISMGGFGTWEALGRWPGYFAAAVPVCGGGDPAAAHRMVRTPIWAFHGAEDRIVGVEYSRQMIEAVRRAGGTPKYTEYPGVGHASWDRVYRDPAVYAWLFGQRLP